MHTSWLYLLTYMSRSYEKTNNEGPISWVPRNKAISSCRYSFQVQQHLAESEKCYNANDGKIKFKERSTFRRCPSLEANLDSGARQNMPRQKQTLISINLRLIT